MAIKYSMINIRSNKSLLLEINTYYTTNVQTYRTQLHFAINMICVTRISSVIRPSLIVKPCFSSYSARIFYEDTVALKKN